MNQKFFSLDPESCIYTDRVKRKQSLKKKKMLSGPIETFGLGENARTPGKKARYVYSLSPP